MERRIRQEFQELRDFLDGAERTGLQKLKQEEEGKSGAVRRLMDEVEVNISSLSGTIAALEEEMALDGVPLLHVRFYVIWCYFILNSSRSADLSVIHLNFLSVIHLTFLSVIPLTFLSVIHLTFQSFS